MEAYFKCTSLYGFIKIVVIISTLITCTVYLLLSFGLTIQNVLHSIRFTNASQKDTFVMRTKIYNGTKSQIYFPPIPTRLNRNQGNINTSTTGLLVKNIKNTKGMQMMNKNNESDHQNTLYNMKVPLPVRLRIPEVNCGSERFLVYECVSGCGGMGDREKGIISAFLLALLTNRTFVIDMPRPCNLDTFLQVNLYNWQKCRHVVSKKYLNIDVLEYIDVRGRDFGKTIPEANFDEMWKDSVVVMKINVILIDRVRKHRLVRQRIPWLFDYTNEEVFGFVLGILFKLDETISRRIEEFRQVYVKGRTLVCGHIRMGRNPSIPNDSRLRLGAPNEDTIFNFLQNFNDANKYAVYVATDSENIRKQSVKFFPTILTGSQPILHVDRSKVNQSMACEGFGHVIQEQFLLSRCDVLVLTQSGFGAMAAYLRGHSDNLYIHLKKMDKIHKAHTLSEIQRNYNFT